MYRKMPPLTALAAFEAAARHRSFGKAADELCLTQSAVSHRIRLLEAHLRTRLFLRLAKRVVLTPQGEAFVEVVRETLGRLQIAASDLRGPSRRMLRISVLPAFASGWLVQRIAGFYALHADVDLEIHTTTALADLRAGEADIGIRFGPGPYPGLASHRLFDESLFPVASPRYLAGHGAPEVPAALTNAVLLRGRHQRWRPWFQAAGLAWPEPATGPLFTDAGLMLAAAIAGQGVALVRSTLAHDALAAGELVRIGSVAVRSESNFHLVHLPEAGARAEIAAFTRWLLDAARDFARDGPGAKTRSALRAVA